MFGSLGKFPSSFNNQGKIGLAAGEPKKVDNSQRANFQDYGESFSPSLSDIERTAFEKTFSLIEGKVQELQKEIQKLV